MSREINPKSALRAWSLPNPEIFVHRAIVPPERGPEEAQNTRKPGTPSTLIEPIAVKHVESANPISAGRQCVYRTDPQEKPAQGLIKPRGCRYYTSVPFRYIARHIERRD